MNIEEYRNDIIDLLSIPDEEKAVKYPTHYFNRIGFVDVSDEGELTLSYDVQMHHRNGNMLLQGGMLASFIDDNFGIMTHSLSQRHHLSTIDLNITYHKAVPVDIDRVLVTSHITSAGKRIVSLRAEAYTPDGVLLATAQSNMFNKDGVWIGLEK